jgi:carboxyl-terminal processing protease
LHKNEIEMKKKINKFRVFAALLLIGILTIGFTARTSDFELVKSLDIFYTLFRELNLYYVDETKPDKLIETGINSMLNSLDPYTTYIPESEMDDFNFMTTGEYGGIGSLIRAGESYAIIAEPYEGSPSAKAGLMAGDEIISVDGFVTKGKPLSEVSEKLKGVPGTELTVIIRKPGEKEDQKIKIVREQIHIKNVSYYGVLSNRTGYIRLSNFTMNAGNEVREAILDLKKNSGIDKLILDLRGNPGGLLIEAVRVCNIFVEKGQLIVSTKGKVSQWDQEYFTSMDALDTKIPLVVLVNRGSASASEIVAGALQDIDRAVILGQRTYGKGLVQTTRKLKYNTQLKVTTAKYYIPSGRCIQALDYTHRNEDGSVGDIPDSLISKFKTKGGRLVYDGGGINPDVIDSMDVYNQLSMYLYAKNLIFDFATDYTVRHKEKPAMNSYKIGDEEYGRFKEFVKNKGFEYETQSESELKKLISTAKAEKYYDLAAEEFAVLEKKLAHDDDRDLNNFRKEIEEVINEEVISRYYYQKGRISLSVETDTQVLKAVELLDEKGEIEKILVSDSGVNSSAG